MWPLASKRARDKHPEASLKGWRAGGATTVTAGQRTPSGALMAKALTDGADEAKRQERRHGHREGLKDTQGQPRGHLDRALGAAGRLRGRRRKTRLDSTTA